MVKKLPANTADIRHVGWIPGLGRSPEGRHGNPLWYSCLENLMDRGAWWATIHRVAKSWTRLKLLSTQHSHVSQRVILGNTRTSTHLDGPVNNFADSTGGSHFKHCNLHKQDVRKMFLDNMCDKILSNLYFLCEKKQENFSTNTHH